MRNGFRITTLFDPHSLQHSSKGLQDTQHMFLNALRSRDRHTLSYKIVQEHVRMRSAHVWPVVPLEPRSDPSLGLRDATA